MPDALPAKPFSPDDALPPVQPPSAGFLVQLFLIPGIIVAIIVVVWLLFHWLAQMGNDPKKYIQDLRGGGETRWQAAVNLAGALRNPQNEPLRRDPALAAEMGAILVDEIAGGSMEERPLNLRVYLCLAIGQFQTDAGLPSLLKAATTERDVKEAAVRLAAIKALGDLARNVRAAGNGELTDPEMLRTLLAASREDAAPLRAAAALALGAIGGAEAIARLHQMLGDSETEVRYDVALALADRGDFKSLDTLLDMLSPDQSVLLKNLSESQQMERQKLIQVSGLRGLVQLAEAHPTADLSPAAAPVAELTKSDIFEVRSGALDVQKRLAGRRAEEPEESERVRE